MTNSKSTKRALLSSVIALLVCFTMLLGSTFAWFTDSAASNNNKIKAGTLDVKLYQWTGLNPETDKKDISDSKDPVFTDAIIWEPGKTEVVYFSIENAGNLALKYTVALDVTAVSTHSLTDVMEYMISPDAKFGDLTYDDVNPWGNKGTKVVPGANETTAKSVTLLPGEAHYFALSVHMLETATNEYMNETITFDIRVLAGQATHESDSFGNTYDQHAGYPGSGSAALPSGTATATEIRVVDDEGYKVGSVLIKNDSIATDATALKANITKSFYNGNFTAQVGPDVIKYDVTVEGLKDDNTVPVKVELRIPAGLDDNYISLYHYDEPITDFLYDPNTGYVLFETTNFSPFTIFFDDTKEYVAPETPKDEDEKPLYPQAIINYAPEYVGEGAVQWGSYGQWMPTPGLDQNLEVAFTFACPAETDENRAILEAYRNWYCDFFVSLDKDLGENEIFLGGYYATYGAYVGFHNNGFTLEAGQEIGLLDSVTSNAWTYAKVEKVVKTFVCGVGDVDDALDGATFTVKLRLTDPENEDNFIDVNVVKYTFGGNANIDGETVVTSAQGLQDAINNGDGNISLGGDIDLNQGIPGL